MYFCNNIKEIIIHPKHHFTLSPPFGVEILTQDLIQPADQLPRRLLQIGSAETFFSLLTTMHLCFFSKPAGHAAFFRSSVP